MYIEDRLDDLEARVAKLEKPDKFDFYCDFTSGLGSFGVQAKYPSRVSIIDTDRGKAVRLHTEPGDSNLFGSNTHERCDLSLSQKDTDGFEGSEHWVAHSILLPNDYDVLPMSNGMWHWGALFGWHSTANQGEQGNFTIFSYPLAAIDPKRPTGITYRGYGGLVDQGKFEGTIRPIIKNSWMDFVHHIRWSATDGIFESWLNGRKFLTHKGPTLYKGQGVYLKPANYHTPTGRPSSVIHSRIVRGKSASVSLQPLEGVI